MTVLLALASSLLWGVADYFGGKQSRRVPTLVVVLISQASGLLVVVLTPTVAGSFSAPTGYIPWAVGAGVAGASGVVLFYRALAIGTMGVVAPLAALGVVVPVLIGLFGGALPSVVSLVGMVVAVIGVVTTAGPSRSGSNAGGQARSVWLALGAAAAFGLLQYAISGGSKYSTVMTMVVMRVSSVPGLAVITWFALRPSSSGDRVAVRAALDPRTVLIVVVIGVFDVGANLLFATASVSGALAIVAVLGSLYPAATVLLARVIDRERLTGIQNVGVLAAVVGVALIAAGA